MKGMGEQVMEAGKPPRAELTSGRHYHLGRGGGWRRWWYHQLSGCQNFLFSTEILVGHPHYIAQGRVLQKLESQWPAWWELEPQRAFSSCQRSCLQ